MKGIELPINILVIIAVAIIVLLGVIALFYSAWFPGVAPVGSQSAITAACGQASRQGCSVAVPADLSVSYKTYTSLEDFCENEYTSMTWGATPWAADSTDARQCLNLACGMGCI